MKNYVTFESLVEKINSVSKYKVDIFNHHGKHLGIKLRDKPLPISINESEYNYMHDIIVDNNLSFGIELSTGVGISTIGLASAFNKTGGILISLDSYYEEIHSISSNIPILNYTEEDIKMIKRDAKAYNLAKTMIENENLTNNVDLEIGWSPSDLVRLIQLKNKKVDFVFLDCPKSDDEFKRDITALYPHLSDKCIMCVHDTHTFSVKSNQLVKQLFNKDFDYVKSYYVGTPYESHRYYSLGVINTMI
jgi:predicted O-methyltransferase YrrM